MSSKPLQVLLVSGFGERVGDDSALWQIAVALHSPAGTKVSGWREEGNSLRLQLAPNVTIDLIERQWDTLAPADLRNIDVAITYSYGQAALWHALHGLPPEERPRIQHLFILAGVPRLWWGQMYGTVWTIPAYIEKATAFNIDAIPASCGIHNESANYINVDCRSWGLDHISIQGEPRIRKQIVDAIRGLAGASTPEGTS